MMLRQGKTTGGQPASVLCARCCRFTYTDERINRYVGLRWSEPKPRKVVSRKKGSKGDDSDSTDEVTGTTGLSKILRPSMNLSGYVSGEWDIRGGTF